MSEKRSIKTNNGDEKSSSVLSRPPLKKRFVLGSGTTSTVRDPHPPKRQAFANKLPDNLSKKELLEHMYSVKNAYIQEKQYLGQLKDNAAEANALYGAIRLQFTMLRDELAAFPAIGNLPGESENSSIANQLKQVCLKITEKIQSWNAQTNQLMSAEFQSADLEKQGQTLSNYIRFDMEQLVASDPGTTVNSLRQANETKLSLIAKTTSDIKSTLGHLEKSNDLLENCVQSIASIEKRQDRLQSDVVASALGSLSTSTPVGDKEVDMTEQPDELPQRTQMDKLIECQQLLASRNQELAQNQQDREELHSRLDDLLDRLARLSSDYIKYNSIYVNHLQFMDELECNLADYYEQRRIHLLKEEDIFSREREQLVNQQKSEMASREAMFANETKRLQETLTRIRHNRDELQHVFQRRVMEEKEARAYNDQIIKVADEQQSRMVELEQDVLHKRQAMDTETLLPDDYLNYRKLKLQIEKTHGILHGLRQHKQVNNAQRVMDSPLMDILNLLILHRQQLELLILFYENTELDLYAQMDYDGSAIERRIPLIQRQINDKRAHQQKLQAEISKFVSSNAKLADKKHENDIQYAQHRHQTQLHEKSISHLDEKIASIEAEIMEKEKDLGQLETNVEHYRLTFDDISQESNELQSNYEKYESHLSQLLDMAKEKNKILEQETLLVQQAKSEHEKFLKRWNLIQQGENPASQELIDEVEELRAHFKCSACKTRTRECILTSCMHTFCNECIRIRLETRQRRCPSCAITFGASDVKGICLYGK
ncbi:hypothetical protein BD408DRAFT_424216 [Parasitella parasitica]|nr:hypothetical protein BD408DRAFT_424216 [Parasitella parasitica]